MQIVMASEKCPRSAIYSVERLNTQSEFNGLMASQKPFERVASMMQSRIT